MREFNTSGPNNPEKHYTIFRTELVEAGKKLVKNKKYFTVWAPRQTGKSTWFKQLAGELEKEDYQIASINFENYRKANLDSFLKKLIGEMNRFWGISLKKMPLSDVFYTLENISDKKLVLIIDEVEGINSDYFGDFLHNIRSLYHTRDFHGLHSVILIGVSNITGIIQDNASPFNIADNLAIPYFSNEDTQKLLGQHEKETGQLFEAKVKKKISEITANQPGLVNGFANQLVTRHPTKKILDYQDYLNVEKWYLTKVIDKNVANIIKIAKQHRNFVERLLFIDENIEFDINEPAIEQLHINGLIHWDKHDNVKFWVPLYQKRLFKSFYPHTNGEKKFMMRSMPLFKIIDEERQFQYPTPHFFF